MAMNEIILQMMSDVCAAYFGDLNSFLYFVFHLLVVWLLWSSIYYRYVRGPLFQWFYKAKVAGKQRLLVAYQKYSALFKVRMDRWKRQLEKDKAIKKATKNVTLEISGVIQAHSIGAAQISMKRGESSWAHFSLAWTVISVLVIEFNSIYSSMKPSSMSLGILIMDLSAITYLCFFSGWFRNKVIQVVNFRNNTYE